MNNEIIQQLCDLGFERTHKYINWFTAMNTENPIRKFEVFEGETAWMVAIYVDCRVINFQDVIGPFDLEDVPTIIIRTQEYINRLGEKVLTPEKRRMRERMAALQDNVHATFFTPQDRVYVAKGGARSEGVVTKVKDGEVHVRADSKDYVFCLDADTAWVASEDFYLRTVP